MPQETPVLTMFDQGRDLEQRRTFIDPNEELSTDDAAQLVLSTLQSYETSRTQHHDPDWAKADELYFGLMPVRYWPGTNKRRSNLPVQVMFDHLESAFPSVVSTVFANEPDWFEVLPSDTRTEPANARAIKSRLRKTLTQQTEGLGPTGNWALELAVRSAMHYKIGIVEVGYDVLRQRPFVKWLDPRNVYFSPSVGNWVDTSPSWIKRVPMSIEELEKFRDLDGFNLPSPGVLNSLAKSRGTTLGESTLDDSRAIAGLERMLGHLEPNPADQFIDVIVYQSDDREIWMLDRKWVAWNKPNKWGFKTVVAAPYFLILGSLYGLSFADLLKSEQVFQTRGTNAYLDELSLNINPPRVGSHQVFQHPSKAAWRPGAMYTSANANPAQDMQPIFTGGITRDIFVALGESDRRAGRRTGQSDAVIQGVPVPSNANRTATGAQLPLRAASARQFSPIRVLESLLLVPTLQKLTKIIQIVEGQDALVEGLSSDRQPEALEGPQLQGRFDFEINAGTRALARERLLPILPLALQFIQSTTEQMVKIGKVPDFDDIERMVQDATGTTRRYRWFREITPQELQKFNQPSPDDRARLQAEQLKSQTRLQVAEQSARAKQQETETKTQAEREKVGEKSAVDILKTLLSVTGGNTGDNERD